MNMQCDCAVVLPGLTDDRADILPREQRQQPARANHSSTLLAIREEALKRRGENYAWLILALNSASVLVLALWI